MKRHLTEPEAWREIARRVAERGLDSGLCMEIATLESEAVIDETIRLDMKERILRHMNASTMRYWLFFDAPGYAESRVLAALFLALDAEDDA